MKFINVEINETLMTELLSMCFEIHCTVG